MNGNVRKARGTGTPSASTPTKTTNVTRASDAASAIASIPFANDHRGHPFALQQRTSGATTIIPAASPSHQVHTLTRKSGHESAFLSSSAKTPTPAAIVALSVIEPT